VNYSIKTGYNKAFQWAKENDISFIGYLSGKDPLIINKETIRNTFQHCASVEDFKQVISRLNGVFSIVVIRRDFVLAASDSTRFFPVFYAFRDNRIILSDDIDFVRSETNHNTLNDQGCLEYLASGFANGNRTLYDNIFQVRPGEIFLCDGKSTSTEFFTRFSCSANEIINHKPDDLYSEARKKIDDAFRRILEPLNNMPVALPLSGGMDSRLIACKLKEYGFRNVVCFTYGRRTKEVDISGKVAEELGFSWHFIEYNQELIAGFHRYELFEQYTRYASRGASMFYLQEYPAIKYLSEKGIVDDSFVAMPGHSGDLLRGALLVKSYPVNCSRKDMAGIILDRKFIHKPLNSSEKARLLSQLQDELYELNNDPSLLPYSILEDWEMKERTAKYIFNSSHAFTFFGIKTFFPLADKELIDFFRRLPVSGRKFGSLYNQIVRECYFKPNKVLFSDEIHPSGFSTSLDRYKKSIRPFLPGFIKKKLLQKNDWEYYGPMTEYLLNELKSRNIHPDTNYASYLYRILNYYLMLIKLSDH
jgi:asparagine synthase (glutamine-hydrolysing)